MTDLDKAIALRPSYWASVSGGKDSLYMLNLRQNMAYVEDVSIRL